MKILILFLALMFTGCASTGSSMVLDTPEKVLFDLEKSWNELMITIDKNRHMLTDAQRAEVKEAVIKTHEAFKAARLAVAVSNGALFDENQDILLTAINTLTYIINTFGDEEVHYENRQLEIST